MLKAIEILQPFKPLPSCYVNDVGGLEVVGWLHCPLPWAWLGWIPLLVDRNVHGCIPYNNNPLPWPGYYWSIENAEKSHLSSPWIVLINLLVYQDICSRCLDMESFISGNW
jgi:hypothetical protein